MVNEPSFTLNPSKGGMNWGYCVPEKKAPPVTFFAIVETSGLVRSETKYNKQLILFIKLGN